MLCQRCNSDRIIQLDDKVGGECLIRYKDREIISSIPDETGIADGSYLRADICLECGQIQGKFPAPKINWKDYESYADDEEPDDDFD